MRCSVGFAMTKEGEKEIGKILAFAKREKRKRDSRNDIKARRMRMLDARWPHFVELLHAGFREFIDKFEKRLPARSMKVAETDDSITATSRRTSVTVASDLDALMLTVTYKTLRARDTQTSDLPFYVRLGEDDQIEIHNIPNGDWLLPLDNFLFRVLGPFFMEVADKEP